MSCVVGVFNLRAFKKCLIYIMTASDYHRESSLRIQSTVSQKCHVKLDCSLESASSTGPRNLELHMFTFMDRLCCEFQAINPSKTSHLTFQCQLHTLLYVTRNSWDWMLNLGLDTRLGLKPGLRLNTKFVTCHTPNSRLQAKFIHLHNILNEEVSSVCHVCTHKMLSVTFNHVYSVMKLNLLWYLTWHFSVQYTQQPSGHTTMRQHRNNVDATS